MSVGRMDLNLLTALKALLEESNVTRAGARLGLRQPAMSAALSRLRRRFDDELLIRQGREYVLTPFAAELLPQVQESVRLLEAALLIEDEFEPATSQRAFRLTMSDYAISVLHGHLMRLVRTQAPGIHLLVDHVGPDARKSDRVLVEYDILVGPLGYGFPGEARPLWRDRFVCLVDRNNPRLREGMLTLDDLAALPHAVASFGRGNLTPIDRTFGELGLDRRIEVEVDGWLPLPFVVEGTDLVTVVPERLARRHARPGGPLAIVEPSFGYVLLAEGYWYARNRLSDPAHRWLFAQLDALRQVLAESDPAPA